MTRQIFPIFITCVTLFNLHIVVAQAQTDFRVAGSQRAAVEGTPVNNNNNNRSNSSGESGHLSKKKQRFNEAVDINREGIAENKLGTACWNNRDWDGAIYHYQLAINYYQQAVDKYPKGNTWKENLDNNVKFLARVKALKSFFQGNDYYNSGSYYEAEMAYRQAFEFDPTNANAHNNLGLALKMQGKNDEAIREFREALRIDPNVENASRQLQKLLDEIAGESISKNIETSVQVNADANALYEKGDYKGAEALYKKALALNNTDKMIYDNLGGVQMALGKYAEAEASFRDAIFLDPSDVITINRLGYALEKQSKLKEAETVFRQSLAKDPSHGFSYYGLAHVLATEGIIDGVEAYYRKAIELQPGGNVAFYNDLGKFLEQQGSYTSALLVYQGGLVAFPTNTVATEAVARLNKEGNITTHVGNTTPGTITDPGVQLQSSKIQGFDVVIDGKGKYFVGLLPFVVDGSTPYAEKVPLELAKTEKFQELLKAEGKIREEYTAMQIKLKDIQAQKTSATVDIDKKILEKRESDIKQNMSKKEGEFAMKRFEQTEAIRKFHEDLEEAPNKNSSEVKKQ